MQSIIQVQIVIFIEIIIKDDGEGIDKKDLPHIKEHHTTSKEQEDIIKEFKKKFVIEA